MKEHSVKTKAIWPSSLSLEDLKERKAYCGVSLNNPVYYGKKLSALLHFLSKNFRNLTIITSGYLFRYYYRLFLDNDEDALNQALKVESDFISNQLNPALRNIAMGNKIEIKRWSDFYNMAAFSSSFNEIADLYARELSFKGEIHQMAEKFIANKKGMTVNHLESEAEKYAKMFLLEEIAMFDFLISQGFEVDVYPGNHVPFLNNISEKFANAPQNLKKRIVLELSMHRS